MYQNTKKSNTKSAGKFHYAGIDISKERLDVYCADKHQSFPNNDKGLKDLKELINSQPDKTLIAYESTGNLSTPLARKLNKLGLESICINPLRVRNYARAIGAYAKTDRVDCRTIMRFAQDMELSPNVSTNEIHYQLKEYESTAELYTREIAKLKTSLDGRKEKLIIKSIERSIRFLTKELEALDAKIEQLIKSDPELNAKYEFYLTFQGIGPRVAKGLIIHMEELGSLNRGQVASLVGVAPFNHDSGHMKGKRIPRYGRKRVRNLLYMSVIAQLKLDNVLSNFYQRLKKEGKPSKVAIVASIRKLAIYLNARTRQWLESRAKISST